MPISIDIDEIKWVLFVLLSLLFSFFIRRGRVFEADPFDNTGTYFKCHTAIQLLQHGVDPSLKQLCRSHIRIQLRAALNDSTMFTAIEKLPLPTSLKRFLKLQDIIDLDDLDKKAIYMSCPFPYIFTRWINQQCNWKCSRCYYYFLMLNFWIC